MVRLTSYCYEINFFALKRCRVVCSRWSSCYSSEKSIDHPKGAVSSENLFTFSPIFHCFEKFAQQSAGAFYVFVAYAKAFRSSKFNRAFRSSDYIYFERFQNNSATLSCRNTHHLCSYKILSLVSILTLHVMEYLSCTFFYDKRL